MEINLANLDDIELASGSHTSPKQGHCLLEVVSLFANEPFGDSPECVDPVLAAFGRAWNDGMRSNEERAQLKQYITRLPGTAGSKALSEKRSWMAFDWLVRVHCAAWLALTPSLKIHADILIQMPAITCQDELNIALPKINAARDAAWDAARDDARDAAWDAVGDAAWDATWDAAWAAARAAAWAAARATAWDAVGDAVGDDARDDARDAAWDAAWAAARAAACDAARDAAWDAAWAAARAAARAAAWDAVGDAAWDATWDVAWAAARAAAWAAARATAWDAVGDALKPTVKILQASAHELFSSIIDAKED
jgi:hypothetical protein